MAYSRTDGDRLYDIDVNMMAEAAAGNGVITGCAITATGSPDWETHVAAGGMNIAGTLTKVAAADKTHDTPSGTNLRWDLLEVGTNGTVDIVKGTEVTVGNVAVKPNASASHVVIAHIYIDGTVGNIPTGSIFDARFMLPTKTVVLRTDATPASTTATDWADLYTITVTDAEAMATKILVHVQGEADAEPAGGYYPSVQMRAFNNDTSTQIGSTSRVYPNTAAGSYLFAPLVLVVPLVAGTHYTRSTGFTLKIQGKKTVSGGTPYGEAHYFSSIVYAEYGV